MGVHRVWFGLNKNQCGHDYYESSHSIASIFPNVSFGLLFGFYIQKPLLKLYVYATT